MKKSFILLLLIVNTSVFAQFKLTGKIVHYAGNSDVKINIPAVYGLFDQSVITLPIAKNGSFNIMLTAKSQKFAYLMHQGNIYPLLLNRNKNLHIELDAYTKGIQIIKGTAQAENDLITKINIEEAPAFLLDDRAARLDRNGLNNQLLRPYYLSRNRKIALVNKAAINPADKKLIAAEIKYITYNNLHELTDMGAENQAVLNKFVADIYSKTTVKPDVMPAGPQYYRFVNNYLAEIEKKTPGKSFSLLKRWDSALKYLPAPVTEQFGYQLMLYAFDSGDKAQIKQLSAAYLKKFPAGVYAAEVR